MINAATVRRITAFQAHGYPVISVYVSTGPDRPDLRTRVGNLLDQISPLAADTSLAHGARLSLGADLGRIEAALLQAPRTAGGAAVFACSGRGLFEEVVLPRPVRDRIVVDGSPWVRPIAAMVDEYPRCGVVVLDGAERHTWELSGDGLHEGQSVEVTPDGYDVLVVGGVPAEVAAYLDGLPRTVRARVAATFDVDPAATTVDEVSRLAVPLAEHHDAESQRRRVAEVLGVYDAGGLAALGLTRCLQAASVGAVRALVVQDGASASGVVCEACGWLGERGDACAACGCPVRRSEDIVDELVESVVDQGGSARRIRVDTPLRGWNVAAALHFSPRTAASDRVELVTTGQIA